MKRVFSNSILLIIACSIWALNIAAQGSKQINKKSSAISAISSVPASFGAISSFVAQAGQYVTEKQYASLGKIYGAYEGFAMPVLFTSKGVIYLQKKQTRLTHSEEERLEKMGISEEEIENKRETRKRTISMEWLDANASAEIMLLEKTTDYHTYGRLPDKAFGYKKILYKNMYPGIDILYTLKANKTRGFEYSLIVHPGADISKVKMQYGGDIKKIQLKKNNTLLARSDIDSIYQSGLTSFTTDDETDWTIGDEAEKENKIETHFDIQHNTVGFQVIGAYDHNKILVIDPFVTSSSNLDGANTGKAKDVDFDYEGNIYVTGGGDGTNHRLSKYSATGVLQWTFSGALINEAWSFGPYFGGWVVDKTNGNTYIGQGFAPGFRVARISTLGVYDNYITVANPSFMENWKMIWRCNNGVPQILIAGGGINSNINLGILEPPATAITSSNITGIPYTGTGFAQDIADMVIDPVSNDMYSIFASLIGTPILNNKIYKHQAPYTPATIGWSISSGFNSLSEAANRPYMGGAGFSENSINSLSVNSSFFYYWDGVNLKAINKSTGADVGAAFSVNTNSNLMCGGIVANECNTIFIGSQNGTVKVLQFDGVSFNDAAWPDMSIPGFAANSVYDIVYDEGRKLLYASGDGFVASIDVSAYACANTSYTLQVTPDCINSSATALLTPTPPSGFTQSFSLYQGTTFIESNNTGVFTNLLPNTTYTVKAFVNQVCSGVQTIQDFVMPNPSLTYTQSDPTCGNNNGSITGIAAGGTAPYQFSQDSINYVSTAIFSGLTGGLYPLSVKDANGCRTTVTVNLLNSNGPVITASSSNTFCGINNGTITASATGTGPFQYSINGVDYSSSNQFTSLSPSTYTLTVRDGNGCINSKQLTIISIGGASLLAVPTHATCNKTNGSITLQATGGTAPLTYSIDGVHYVSSTVFSSLAAGNYNVYVKDANNCINDTAITILNNPGPGLVASVTAASCNNINGTIVSTVSGGTPPYQYSIDGIVFQSNGFYSALAAGAYALTVRDATGCATTIPVTITSVSAPQLSVSTTTSSCAASTGSITVTASGGQAPLQYSINGSAFQISNVFNSLAPGNYTVFVKDATGCINITTTTVSALAGPSLTATITNAGCNNNDGIIVANGGSGTPPFQYKINTGAYQVSSTFSNLSTGNYTLTIKDNNNCTATVNATVASSIGLLLRASSIFASCSSNNGIITAVASGGAAPLTYSIDGVTFQVSNQFTNLAPATYTVTVKDNNGCKITTTSTVGIINAPVVSAIATNSNCNGSNGTITATASSGTPPYQYSLDGITYQTSNIFQSVASGAYTVTLKDANNCIVTSSVTVNNIGTGPGPTLALTIRNTTCTNTDGRVIFDANGGKKPYTFFINGSADNGSNSNHLPAGVYNVMVVDKNGCTATGSVTIGNDPAAVLSATTTTSLCNLATGSITVTTSGGTAPFSYSLDGITFQASNIFNNVAAGSYIIRVTDANTCSSTKAVQVLNSDGPNVTTIQTDAYCSASNGTITTNGTGIGTLSYSIDNINFQVSNSFPNLSSGTYTITVQDGNGCKNTTQVILGDVAAPIVTPVITNASCNSNNGTIILNATGGLPPYQYSIDGTIFQTSNTFSNLTPATYTVIVMDANNCFTRSNVVVGNVTMPSVIAFATPTNCQSSSGALLVAGSGGVSPYQYSIDGTVFQSSTSFNNLSSGLYTVYIKDANGCTNLTKINLATTNGVVLTTSVTNAGCNNTEGSITLNGSGGAAPLSYSIDGSNFQLSNLFSNLNPGIYPVVVKDNTNCQTASVITITRLDKPTLTASSTPASCNIGNGQINAIGSGGLAPLQYSIDGTNFQNTEVFTALVNGDYDLVVKDTNGCMDTAQVTVFNFTAPQLSATALGSCGTPGAIIATGTGGEGLLSYTIDGSNYFGSGTFNNVASGSYTVAVKDGNGCIDNTGVVVTAFTTNPKTWFGVNTDWQDPANWCGGVPTINNDVVIPSGLSNYPDINNGVAYSRDLTIQANATVTISTKIQIARAINNAGILNALAGTIELTGSANQNIAGSMFYQNTINQLIISNTSTSGVNVSAAIGDTLKISNKLSFGVNDAVLNTGNHITLLSSDTATASMGIISENVDGSARATINGHLIIERYYPSKRAWRLITAPIQADADAPSINAAWQENANPPSITGVSNPDPSPTYGTHITGPYNSNSAYTPIVTNSGFDQSPQNNSSLKYYSKLTNTITPVTNTLTTKVTDYQGYLMFVRGDRSYDISSTTNFTTPSSTIIRVEGNAKKGLINIPADTGLQIIGNPYPSSIRFDETMFTNNASILKNQSFMLWDPLKGSAENSPVNVGGWVPIAYVGNGNYFSTYNPSLSIAGLETAHPFEIDGSIQSGAAFMVENNNTATGNFVIHESSKIDGSHNHLFRPSGMNINYMITNIFRTDTDKKPVYWADGTAVLFNDKYLNRTDYTEDVHKITGSGENLYIRYNNQKISIEKRKNFLPGDTLFYELTKVKVGSYKFEIFFNTTGNQISAPFFEDNYTGIQTPISFTEHTMIDVDITAATASFATDRFRLIFKPISVQPLKLVSFTGVLQNGLVALKWIVENQENIQEYLIESSADGINFTPLINTPAFVNESSGHTYNTFDQHPLVGDNFYRIKIKENDGGFHYSPIVLVNTTNSISYIKVFPNPVQERKIQLFLYKMKAGIYDWELYNSTGQLVATEELSHTGADHMYGLLPATKLPQGVYQLKLIHPDKSNECIKVIMQ